ncbi:MAG: DoxX family protein [Gammaproteobacteria bacterium]|nr:DoxX family protein [Gammaproteobacteria bacterium]
MFTVLDKLKPHAHWLLRLCLASVFIFHGSMKFMNLEGFAQMMGLSAPIAVLVAFAEVAGGIGIIVGGLSSDLITRLAGLAIAPVMLGAIFMVHWGRWNFMPAEGFPAGGMEFQVVLLLIAAYFVVVGNKISNQTS